MTRDIKEPDRKAPRYRSEQYDPIHKEFVKALKKKFPQYKDWSISRIRKIIRHSNEVIYRTVVEWRDGVRLPNNMGYLYIAACAAPTTKKPINYKLSLLAKKVVTQRNWESDSHLAKIIYTPFETANGFTNKELYGFKGCRRFRHLVSQEFPKNWKNYIELLGNVKASKLYRAEKIREFQQKQLPFKEYNEFLMD